MSKVVVTGYGVKAPNTSNSKEFVDNLVNGVCCLETVNHLTPKGESTVVGVIKEDLLEFLPDKAYARFPRTALLGMAAGKEALSHSKLSDLKSKKIGVFFGVSVGNIGDVNFQESILNVHQNNYREVPIIFGHQGNHHSITSAIAHYLGTKGMTKTISTGCTSSLEAIQDAAVYLKSGVIDVAIVGGVDSPISKAAAFAFAKTKVLPLNQSLDDAAVPFQSSSKGFAMSEGAGVIILERETDALKREAIILGEIDRIVSNNDGVFIYSVDQSGEQMINALREVLNHRHPDYVNSQALGIQLNDIIEQKCSKELLNHKVPYTSIKSMIGNPFGAIGIIQVISSLISINYGFIPPTIRTRKKGFEDMNIVCDTIFKEINEVAITNHGYGGNNACAYIKSYKKGESS
ncbi:beta-ketoacyl synthase N-terminal-like domain-containing protein [Halalkalibacter okhensis]|uniref:Beta-ketoacyl synthase n=1 Tax=Halalkalibacter okhensis TaxID=333138 RepID=A0A0B0IFU1_9BACI|nr:beta-ketoacyl synthase N-terminal-like domain-containing protein [Halalkalibacter okhensis]KHF38904.1 beta-ketoacyl synthase [Halalkalibacter okhensis]